MTTEDVDRDVRSSEYPDMISPRGVPSVDAATLAVTAPAVATSSGGGQLVPHPRSRNLKGPAIDCGTLEGRDHQATGAC